jgi:pilus assembly protein CpaE
VSDAMNQGLPISATARHSGVSRSLQTLAENIVNGTSTSGQERARRTSVFSRLLGRQAPPKLEMM